MALGLVFAAVMVLTMLLLIGAMYRGGGVQATQRQAGTLMLMTLVLAAIAVVAFVQAT